MKGRRKLARESQATPAARTPGLNDAGTSSLDELFGGDGDDSDQHAAVLLRGLNRHGGLASTPESPATIAARAAVAARARGAESNSGSAASHESEMSDDDDDDHHETPTSPMKRQRTRYVLSEAESD